jgi:hypothetical protein
MKKMKMKESHCHLQSSNQPESGARLFNPIQNRTFVYRSINPNRMPLGTAELERGAEAVRFNLIRRRKVLANPNRMPLGTAELERGAEAVRFNVIRRRKILANPHRMALGTTDHGKTTPALLQHNHPVTILHQASGYKRKAERYMHPNQHRLLPQHMQPVRTPEDIKPKLPMRGRSALVEVRKCLIKCTTCKGSNHWDSLNVHFLLQVRA